MGFNFIFFKKPFSLFLLLGLTLMQGFLVKLGFCQSNTEGVQPILPNLSSPRDVEYKKDRTPVEYLGKELNIQRHSKPLPYKQYDFEHVYPNTDAAVIYIAPETPFLEIEPKNPLEKERLISWLKEWDRVIESRSLVAKYRESYLLDKDVDYLKKAFDLQKGVISDLAQLQNIIWPNSEYSYKAYKQRLIDCGLFVEFLAYAASEDVMVEDSDKNVCVDIN